MKNKSQGVELYQKTVDAGNSKAITRLGHCYQYGKSVNQDINQAVKLYQKTNIATLMTNASIRTWIKLSNCIKRQLIQIPVHLLDIEQELLQEVQVLIEYVDIDKLLAINFININKFEPLFTYASENKIVDLINNKYNGNSNANKDLKSEDEDESLFLLFTHQDKTALKNTLHHCKEQYSEKVDSDFFKTLKTLIHNTVLKVQEEKKQLQIDSFFK
ncbi:hypothetical protein G9A89_000745 [Geosiphon pyriformis]|nr:hypothetical protein G9A89_000745 [Geosiphon pyriformis]